MSLDTKTSGEKNCSKWKGQVPTSTGLHKTNIRIALVAGLFVLVLSTLFSCQSPKPQPKEEPSAANGTSLPTELISSLPKDYSNWVDARPRDFSNKQVYQEETKQSKSEMNKFLDRERVRRRKRAIAARESELFVSGVETETPEGPPLFNSSSSTSKSVSPDTILNPRDSANRQDEKASFLYQDRGGERWLRSGLENPRSSYELLAGAVIPGVLLTGLNSDLPGQIIGQVSKNIYDTVSGEYLLVPQGSKVIGLYDSRVSFGQERMLVVWSRMILPNGKSINLEAMPGVDRSGRSGFGGKVNNHYAKLFSGALFGSIFGAGAQLVAGSSKTIDPSFQQLAVEGAAQNLNQVGQQITERNLNIQPTLEVPPGARFSVFVTKDISLEPYIEE